MEMASVPRRDFLGGAVGLLAAAATGGCATMSASAPSDPAAAVPKLAYVGCYTTKERDGHGEGINVYQIDAATGNWTHLQMLPEVNPSFLTFDRQKRMLYSAHGDGGEATAYRVEAASGRLAVTNKQPTNGKNGVSLAVDATNRFLILANYSSGTVSVLPINTDGSLAPLSDLYTLPGKPGPSRPARIPTTSCSIPGCASSWCPTRDSMRISSSASTRSPASSRPPRRRRWRAGLARGHGTAHSIPPCPTPTSSTSSTPQSPPSASIRIAASSRRSR